MEPLDKVCGRCPLRCQYIRLQRGIWPLHSVKADATFSEGLNSVECNVTVKIGELEFGPFSFVPDNIPGGDDDAKQDEDVALPEAD